MSFIVSGMWMLAICQRHGYLTLLAVCAIVKINRGSEVQTDTGGFVWAFLPDGDDEAEI
ncbi:hypothetical protein [Selenomonas ruminantium]|uniref:hypothetical protein n=1 Tax=Selenomonas ruminantium TaxID=971 RepID=UPI0015BADECB|nr:hypothetical protein [Selenomonas ruminantium]